MKLVAVFPIASLIVGIVLSLILGFPLSVGIVFAILVTLVSVKRLGFPLRQQISFGWDGVKQTKPVLTILFLIGLLIPLLMMGGTIPVMIYYGLSVVNADDLLIQSFVLATAVSCLLGTSVGTLSTVGLSLIGIAHAAEVPLGMMAGALISGAMVGERLSPISSSRLLVISSVGMEEKGDGRINKTALLALGVTALLFMLLDVGRINADASQMVREYQELLERHFSVSLIPLLPLIVLIGSYAFRVKAVSALMYGIAAATGIVLFTNPPEWGEFFRTILFGFELHSQTRLDQMVHGGGMKAILQVLLLISLAGFMNGILNKANLLVPIVDRLMGSTQSLTALTGKTVVLSLLVIIISCNQTIPILVLSSTLLQRFSKIAKGRQLLGRTMLDAALVMPVLIPWNGLAMVMSVTLGVPFREVLPYLFFPLLLPVITIVSARQYSTAGKLIHEHKHKQVI
ncbi:Na+/H+ antiporter NhaC family protein [Brevibacillus sp. H7]|uniref:Na+/H+ antiporter NhaC family protein n=1 Tax=Brevibacillus sp. H7 TaxID=3349138 RepID=UPI0038175DF5